MCWKLNVVCAVENAWCGWNDARVTCQCRVSTYQLFTNHFQTCDSGTDTERASPPRRHIDY